jgi:hypothetical protein
MWSILLAVFRFPLGLIALPYKEESQVVILRAARQRHADAIEWRGVPLDPGRA